MNITEDYVSYEIAKLLKEKKFDGLCYCHEFTDYEGNSTTYHTEYPENWNQSEPCVSIPTLGMAMAWLRQIYGIDIIIEITNPSIKNRKYYCMIWDGNNNSYILDLFNSYEEAVEAALKYSLENLI